MFGIVNETPYDLRFYIGRIPVRVHPAFWIIGAFMGWSESWASAIGTNPLATVLVWLGCLFISILVHELGHALVAQACGWPPSIVLYHFGGLAMYRPTHGHTRGRSIAISLAGPGAGFVLYGIICAAEVGFFGFWGASESLMFGGPGRAAAFEKASAAGLSQVAIGFIAYAGIQLKFINLWWGLINLLPVLPLDGGRVSEQLWAMISPRTAVQGPVKLAVATAALAAGYFLINQNLYPGILFGYLAFVNYQSLQRSTGNPW